MSINEGSIEKEGLSEDERKALEEKVETLKDRYAQVERNMVVRHFKEGIPASEAGDYNPITREGRSEAHTFRWPIASPQETTGADPDIVSPELYAAAKGKLAGGFQRPNWWESQEGDEELNFPDYVAPITLPEYKFGQGRNPSSGLHTRTGPAFSDASHPTERELKRINIQNSLIKIIEKDNVPTPDWLRSLQTQRQPQSEQPPPPPTSGAGPRDPTATGGGITGEIDFNEMLPDPHSTDPETGTTYHPDHAWWNSRDGTVSQWRKNTFPRYWYHRPAIDQFGGAPDGGIAAYPSGGSSFEEHGNPDIIWLSQVPYDNEPLGSPRYKKYGDKGPPKGEEEAESRWPTGLGQRLEDPRLHQRSGDAPGDAPEAAWRAGMHVTTRGDFVRGKPHRGQERPLRIIDITKLNNSNLLRSGVNPRDLHDNYLHHAGDIPLEAIVNPSEAIDATKPIVHYIHKNGMHVKSVLDNGNGETMGKFPRSHNMEDTQGRQNSAGQPHWSLGWMRNWRKWQPLLHPSKGAQRAKLESAKVKDLDEPYGEEISYSIEKLMNFVKADTPPNKMIVEDPANMGMDKGPAEMTHVMDVPNYGTVLHSAAIRGPEVGFESPKVGRAIVVATLPDGTRQPFYQRSGTGGIEGSSKKGDWVPVDGIDTGNANKPGWMDKLRTYDHSLPFDHPAQRYGTEDLMKIGHAFDNLRDTVGTPTEEEFAQSGHARSNHEGHYGGSPWSIREINNWLGTEVSKEHNKWAEEIIDSSHPWADTIRKKIFEGHHAAVAARQSKGNVQLMKELSIPNPFAIQKIGYTTQPGSQFDEEDEYVPITQRGRSQELTPAWQDASQSVQQTGKNIGNQSFGLPALGSKEHQRVLNVARNAQDTSFMLHGDLSYPTSPRAEGITGTGPMYSAFDPVSEAHYYLNAIKNQHPGLEVESHMAGHRALATVQNIMQYGNDYFDHPDAIRYLRHERNPDYNWRDEQAAEMEGRPYEEEYYLPSEGKYHIPMSGTYSEGRGGWPEDRPYETEMTIPLEEYHRQLVHDHLHPEMTNAGKGMADELHRKIRMESPAYDPEAEEPYYLSHWPESLHTGGIGGRDASGYEEIVGEPSSQIGQESTPEERTARLDAAVESNKGRTPRYPEGSGKFNSGFWYDTHAERRQQHGERQGTEEPSRFHPFGPTARYQTPSPSDFRSPGYTASQPPASPKRNVFERNFPHHFDEKSVSKLMKFMYKEGDSGAADGLSGTVFTSAHSGIFTPTFGGSKVRRLHQKNRRRQDKKRRRLMGKDKKNGVDRLVQFLGNGSPVFHKRQPNKDMTGQMQGGSAAGQNITPLKQIDWEKRQEGISKVGSHPTMGMNNGGNNTTPIMQEAGMAAPYPQEEDHSVMNRSVEKKPDWNSNNYRVHKQDETVATRGYYIDSDRGEEIPGGGEWPSVQFDDKHRPGAEIPEEDLSVANPFNVQNASPGGSTGIGPPTNQNTMAATGDHPQAAYTEKFDDEEKKQQVITQNDFENRVKQYDNKENDSGTVDQPRAAGATASMTSYPDSGMQMMEKAWGSGPDTYDQDALHRGGDKDMSDDEENIDEDKRDDDGWIPEDESKVKSEKEWLKKFQASYEGFVAKGDTDPMLSTLLALDND